MFIRNDASGEKRYFNGKLAEVVEVDEKEISVIIDGEDEIYKLKKETWEQKRYSLGEDKSIQEEVLGSFKQYPVRLAWAVTIHKSQGSEFNHTALLLPDALNPVLTKELLYTGITRAKNWFSLIETGPGVFEGAVSRNVQRLSGLALQLKAELSKEAQR